MTKINKDQLILVNYINVKNVDAKDIQKFIADVVDSAKDMFDDTVAVLHVPVVDSESRIECINPKYIVQDNKDWEEKINELIEYLNNLN